MKKLLAVVLFTALSFYSFAQKAPIKFGDVSIENLKMTRYEKDTSAAAVVLADYGQTEFSYQESKGWQLLFERIVRIKILNKSGYQWADFSVPLYRNGSNKEKLTGLKGVTYNVENGKIIETKLKNEATFEEKSSENIDLVKFTLPNTKEGSVIEVTYKVLSDFVFNYQDWEFQSFIPTQWSEYRATFPEFFHYEKIMQGYVSLNISESKQKAEQFTIKYESTPKPGSGDIGYKQESYALKSLSTIHRWVAQDVPAFKEEPFLSSYRNYISKINFELGFIQYPNEPIKPVMGTWEDLNKNFLENDYFGSAIKGSGFLKKITEVVTDSVCAKRKKVLRGVAIVANQYPGQKLDKKYLTTFLHQETTFFYGTNQLASLTQYPILYAETRKIKRGYYEVTLITLAEPPSKKDSDEIIERYVKAAERVIREYPSGWLWSHNRWKKRHLYASICEISSRVNCFIILSSVTISSLLSLSFFC